MYIHVDMYACMHVCVRTSVRRLDRSNLFFGLPTMSHSKLRKSFGASDPQAIAQMFSARQSSHGASSSAGDVPSYAGDAPEVESISISSEPDIPSGQGTPPESPIGDRPGLLTIPSSWTKESFSDQLSKAVQSDHEGIDAMIAKRITSLLSEKNHTPPQGNGGPSRARTRRSKRSCSRKPCCPGAGST